MLGSSRACRAVGCGLGCAAAGIPLSDELERENSSTGERGVRAPAPNAFVNLKRARMNIKMKRFDRLAVAVACVALAAACHRNDSSGESTPATVDSASPAASGSAAPSSSASAAPEASGSAAPAASGSAAPEAADAGPPAKAANESFKGRGVFFAGAEVGCPSVGVGTRDDDACLRIGLDDEHSSAEIDREHHRIVLRNDGTYDKEKIVADVILPGWSESAKERAPISVHCVVRKTGKTFSTKVYSHVVNREKGTKEEVENLEVVLMDGTTETVVVNAETAHKVLAEPSVSARLAGFLSEVKDNLAGRAANGAGTHPVADITVAIGLGPAAKDALRAQLFRTGADTEIRLTAMSGLIPEYIVKRDLFLYGLEGATNLDEVKKRGFKSGDTLILAVHDGKGSVKFNGTTSDLPDAANSMRDFLETAFVGMILAHQASLDPSKGHAAPKHGHSHHRHR